MALVLRLASEMPPKEKVMQATARTDRRVSEIAKTAGLKRLEVIYYPMLDTVNCHRTLRHRRLFIGEDLIVNAPPQAVDAIVAHELYHIKKWHNHNLTRTPLKWIARLCRLMAGKRPQWISTILKKDEYRADAFSASIVGKEANIAALNYYLRDPKSLVSSPYSHPSAKQRIAALEKLAD